MFLLIVKRVAIWEVSLCETYSFTDSWEVKQGKKKRHGQGVAAFFVIFWQQAHFVLREQ
jgi:hypothetical protein